MLISWIKKTTLLDYPGKVACIIFTTWCNLRCEYCHNSEFVLPEKIAKIKDFIPKEVFFNFLKTKIWILDWVVICWGEPTIQSDLEGFLEDIKKLWFLVKLDTNWQNPILLKRLIEKKLVDYVAMDIKWDFNDEKLQKLIKIKPFDIKNYLNSIEIIISSDIDYEFRTTLVKNYHNLDDFFKVVSQIKQAKKYFLQNYRSWFTLKENFDWKSFSSKELLDFKEIALKYIGDVKIRI